MSVKEFHLSHQLTAAECNPHEEMPVGLLVERIIEVATKHANSWGVGYADLIKEHHAWVLSRLTLEVERYPKVNENYELITWIEDYNRHFSKRHIEIKASGQTIGYARTIWMVINFDTRTTVDVSKLEYIATNAINKPCPIADQVRLEPFETKREECHTFTYTECDINRHVNTVQYVNLLLNQFTLEHHDALQVSRLEMAFTGECRYAETAQLLFDSDTQGIPNATRIDICIDNAPKVKARITFTNRL